MKQMNKLRLLVAIAYATTLTACNNEPQPTATETEVAPTNTLVPSIMSYDIVNTYPHDPAAFTEGLEVVDSTLYESTGEYGTSDIRISQLFSNKVQHKVPLESRYFGEGLTLLNGKLYQLTYKEQKGFVYDAKSLKLLQTFATNTPEAWGMTNDGTHLIYDDGTATLHYLDPTTFKEVKRLTVTDEHGPVDFVNELEMIKGYIYANVWQTDYIIKIDTATGKVVARANLADLRQRTGIPPLSNQKGAPELLNGIAYNSKTNKIYITGKFWPKLFEIKLDN